MRPHEIDYSDTRKPYFDLENGEILIGADDRQRYLNTGVEALRVVELGELLRKPTHELGVGNEAYDKIDFSEWPRERYILFTRWLNGIVSFPSDLKPHEERINERVFLNARKLGIGPTRHAIRQEFGTLSDLYVEARIADSRKVGLFDDWDIEDAVAYIKRVGGDRRPLGAELNERNKKDPTNPPYLLLDRRFRHIGGMPKIMELAGYPVVRNWDRDDYLYWGVRFMLANGGEAPSQSMIDYLSTKGRGPAAKTISTHFKPLSNFQIEVISKYYEHQHEADKHSQTQLERVEDGLQRGMVPIELFSPFPHDPDADDEQEAALAEELERMYCDRTAAAVVDKLGVTETITRYAKFRVVDEVAPRMGLATKITIARGSAKRSFTSAITKNTSIAIGDIEYTALTEGFFDYIWPDEGLERLKLDDGYKKYRAALSVQARERRERKRQAKEADRAVVTV